MFSGVARRSFVDDLSRARSFLHECSLREALARRRRRGHGLQVDRGNAKSFLEDNAPRTERDFHERPLTGWLSAARNRSAQFRAGRVVGHTSHRSMILKERNVSSFRWTDACSQLRRPLRWWCWAGSVAAPAVVHLFERP